MRGLLGGNAIGAGAVGKFGGMDGQAHFCFERTAEEAAHRVRLPAGGLLQLAERSAAGPFEEGQDLGGFGAAPGRARLPVANCWSVPARGGAFFAMAV